MRTDKTCNWKSSLLYLDRQDRQAKSARRNQIKQRHETVNHKVEILDCGYETPPMVVVTMNGFTFL